MSGGMRRSLKRLLFAVSLVLVSPLVLIAWLEKRLSRSEELFAMCAQIVAVLPGLPGVLLRAAFYCGTLDRCSWELRVGFGSLFTHRGARVEPHVSMGAYCVIGHAAIGSRVMMASRVSIPSGKRQHLDGAGRMVSEPRFDTVTIGANCWIGEGAIIMADVGGESIVTAGAVVTKAMPARTLIGGNPSRAIRPLTTESNRRITSE